MKKAMEKKEGCVLSLVRFTCDDPLRNLASLAKKPRKGNKIFLNKASIKPREYKLVLLSGERPPYLS